MRKIKGVIAVIMAVLMLTALFVPTFAGTFDDGAYATVVTGSDFQGRATDAYDRFGRILGLMKADGMETPHSMLMGGDFTRLLLDDANPGIMLIRNTMTSVYPDFNEESVVCIQGNHDNPAAGFTATGFYDMGAYCLYAINEDSFPWQQNLKIWADKLVASVAADLKSNLDSMISKGDLRPVIVMTHVPLHHTTRQSGGDNKYASYIFDVLNEAGKTLDIVFIFGHNHSDEYDDYIGGAVNFMTCGDTIRIPDAQNTSETVYNEYTLNFTYTNCGYVGYSNNSDNEISTSTLTAGAIRFCENTIRFVKYSEDGLFRQYEITKKNPGTATSEAQATAKQNDTLWAFIKKLFEMIPKLIDMYFAIYFIY